MAGRGRGRGRGGSSIQLEAMGLSRSDFITTSNLQPPPIYPPLELNSSPPKINEVNSYLLTLKQEMKLALSSSSYYINMTNLKPKIERYSDKYETISHRDKGDDIDLDWRLFPSELHPGKMLKSRKSIGRDVGKKIELLDNEDDNEEAQEGKEDGEEKESGDEEVMGEEVEEEDIEEGTDYTSNYFDNGEGYLENDSDDNEEGPTY